MPVGKNARLKKSSRVWCQIRDKKFKYYRDGPLKQELSGTIDFDIVVCDITIEEDYFQSQTESHLSSSASNVEDNEGPTKFKIEVPSMDTVFIFDAQTNKDLTPWSNALF